LFYSKTVYRYQIKGLSETIDRGKTYTAVTKGNGQILIYKKTLHRKLNIWQHKLHTMHGVSTCAT